MRKRRNVLIVIGAFVLIVLAGAFAARRPNENALPVVETTVAYTRFTTRLPETGVVQRPQTQTLAALVAGNLGTLDARPGQRVAAGQAIATIVNPQLESNAQTARDAMLSAQAHARSVAESNATLPAQNRSSIVQAQASVEQARSALSQARTDRVSGSESGLGYAAQTAEQQRTAANAALMTAETDAREARRIFDENQALFNQGAISKDALDQSRAKMLDARVNADQARHNRDSLFEQIARTQPYLSDRVTAAENQLRQAQAALASARANAQNSKSGDLQSAQADALAKADDYQYALGQLARTQIRAPFAGTIETIANQTGDTLRSIQPGDAITAGQAIATISSGRGYVVKTKVDEQDVANVRVGQRARVGGEDLGSRSLDGRVVMISPVAQKSDDPSNTSRQVITTVVLTSAPPFLRDGMTVDVDITTAELTHVLAIPSDAVRRDTDGKPYVFAVRGGHAKRAAIATGAANDVQTVVLRGLHAGDRIVSDKSTPVAEGVAVRPAPSPSPAKSAAAS